jgi:hypothetical protein
MAIGQAAAGTPGAWLERRWVRLMLGVQIPDPYRPLPAGSLCSGPGPWPPTRPPGRTWPTWCCCSRWGWSGS